MISRRSLLRSIPALLAAPAIVRVASLMPISGQKEMLRWQGPLFPVDDELFQLIMYGTRWKLIPHQFADPLPLGEPITYTATRYRRLPLPYVPLTEGLS